MSQKDPVSIFENEAVKSRTDIFLKIE